MVKRVTPPEAAALLAEGWIYLDVRSIPEFDLGHPAGAVNVPLLHHAGRTLVPNPDFERVVTANFPQDSKLILGCKVGARSLQAAALLQAAGYRQVVDLQGGFLGERDAFGRLICRGWVDESLPVEASAPHERTYAGLTRRAEEALLKRRFSEAYSPSATPFF